jgi:hypothetical protein
MSTKHFIYKTTNLLNGKYYYGAHSTENEKDNYLGSGLALERAIKKYGKENFIREIILYCDSVDELYEKEKKIISEHLGKEKCYNMKPGGKGGWFSVNTTDMHKGKNNVMNRCPDIKEKVIRKMMETKLTNKEYYDNISRINGAKAKEKCTGVKCPAKGSSERSKKIWRENYEKMRNSLSSFFLVKSPTGEEYTTNRLEEFCKEKNITYTALWNTSRTNKEVKKGKSKGWLCKKIFHN